MEEHRRTERRSALLRVEMTEHLDGRTWPVEARDVSPSGVFVATKRPTRFHRGEAVTLHIHLAGRADPLVVAGEVVRLVEKADARAHGGLTGVGVEFVTHHDELAHAVPDVRREGAARGS